MTQALQLANALTHRGSRFCIQAPEAGNEARLAEARRLGLVGAGPGNVFEPAVPGERLIVCLRRHVLWLRCRAVGGVIDGEALEPQLLRVSSREQPRLALACTPCRQSVTKVICTYLAF